MKPSNRKVRLATQDTFPPSSAGYEGPSSRSVPASARRGKRGDDSGPSDVEPPRRPGSPAGVGKAQGESGSRRLAILLAVLRAIAGVVLIVGIAGGVALSARRYVKTTPRFAITEVRITGSHHRKDDEILALSGVIKGSNVFSANLDAARAQLLADPWIRDARLERHLPGSVLIAVEERRAVGIVAAGDTYLVTQEGEIFKRLETGDPTDLPIVTGITVQMLTDDRKGAQAMVRRALDLAAEYDRTSLARRSPLQEVHLGGTGGASLIVGKTALTIHLGEPPFRRKLEQAMRVVGELDRRGAKADSIMLDDEARPERVVVRMR